ncbi:hypothetical protein C0J52_21666, partial [Blattella germanica]
LWFIPAPVHANGRIRFLILLCSNSNGIRLERLWWLIVPKAAHRSTVVARKIIMIPTQHICSFISKISIISNVNCI